MTLYEINQALEQTIDSDTGEILDFDALEALSVEKDEKVENCGLLIKNWTAEAKAIREEEKALAERRKVLEHKIDGLTDYLANCLNGEKFTTSKLVLSFRKSKAVEFEDEEAFIKQAMLDGLDEYLNIKDPTVNRTAITNAIKAGTEVPGAKLVEKNSLQIK